MDSTTTRRGSIERWSPTLFLVAGGLFVGHAAILGVQAFSNLTTPPDVFGPSGHLLALGGLLGLYHTLVDRAPIVTRIAGVVTAVAIVNWAVMTLLRFLATARIIPSLSDILPGVFFMLMFASTILTYGLFGVATVLADDSARGIGLLVVAPGALIAAVLVDSAITGVTALDGLVIGGGLALSLLALGYTLRTSDRRPDYDVPASDGTGV